MFSCWSLAVEQLDLLESACYVLFRKIVFDCLPDPLPLRTMAFQIFLRPVLKQNMLIIKPSTAKRLTISDLTCDVCNLLSYKSFEELSGIVLDCFHPKGNCEFLRSSSSISYAVALEAFLVTTAVGFVSKVCPSVVVLPIIAHVKDSLTFNARHSFSLRSRVRVFLKRSPFASWRLCCGEDSIVSAFVVRKRSVFSSWAWLVCVLFSIFCKWPLELAKRFCSRVASFQFCL